MQSKLNLNNQLITLANVKEIFAKVNLDYTPKNIAPYIQAFTHKSYMQKDGTIFNFNKNCVPLQKNCAENFEFVGDSFIENIVCLYLFNRYINEGEGNLTKIKQRIVDSKTLASFGRALQFQKWCLISNYMENTSGRNSDKLLEDTFEAFVFAMYLDLGKDSVEQFVIAVIEKYIDFTEINKTDINYKHQLLELFQKFWNLTPVYNKISEIGPPHQKTYIVVAVDFLGNVLGTGTATMKRDAEQIASQNAIKLFQKVLKSLDSAKTTMSISNFNVTEISDTIKKIKDSITEEQYQFIATAMKEVKMFNVSYSYNNKSYNTSVRYTDENYKLLKTILNDPVKTRMYLSILHSENEKITRKK
jgi:ribonuclease-3